MTDDSTLAQAYCGERGLAEFYERAIKVIAAILLLLALAVTWTTMTDGARPLPLVGGLLLTAGVMYGTLFWGTLPAASVMVVGLVATLTTSLYRYPEANVAAYSCLIVLAAAGTGPWRFGLTAAALSTITLLMVQWQSPEVLTTASVFQGLLLVWGGLLLASLTTRQLQTVADWAWSNYVWAQAQTEEARSHRAELAQRAKSLSAAYDSLDRRNTELAEARAAAEAARRLKAEFAAAVGHELRTPVNLIIGFSELVLEASQVPQAADPLPEAYRQDIEIIYRNARHISQLVDDILDLSQVDAHRMALHKEFVALPDVVQEAIDAVKPLGERDGLALTAGLPPDLPGLLADPVRIRQVLINLLYNAIRFTRQGGVMVTAQQDEASVVVAVADTGVGIPADHLGRVFEEFRQVSQGDRGRGGSGFGLAVCKRFVELHGGSIWATSTVGTGSTFYFRLPLQAHRPSRQDESWPVPVAPDSAQRRRLLVLDHTDDAALIFQRYLDHFEVMAADSPDRARALVTDNPPHALLITSAVGQQIVDRLCSVQPELASLPVVVCPLRTRATLAQTLGVAEYLMKPIRRQQLARAVHRLNRPLHRVVVIEDDGEMSSLLVRMVRSLFPRYGVSAAHDGAAGLQLIRAERPDVILLDLLLPGIDGYGVIQRLRAEEALSHIPVIVISAKGLSEEVVTETLTIRRQGGLSVAETVRCLQASLDVLTRPGLDTAAPLPASSGG